MTTKPVVWIVTPRKEFSMNGAKDILELLDGLDPHYADPIRELNKWENCPWDIRLVITGGGGIYQARNKMISAFMAETSNDEDRFFCADYDLIRTAQDYVDILSHDISIIGGLYTTRSDNGHWVMNRLPYGVQVSERGVMPVMELGTGHKCFKRSVFVKVLADNPWLNCQDDTDPNKRMLSFFSMGPVWDNQLWPGRGRALTEDYWLDWLCRQSGFVTCVDTKVQLRHLDEHTGRVYPAVFPQNPGKLPTESKEP